MVNKQIELEYVFYYQNKIVIFTNSHDFLNYYYILRSEYIPFKSVIRGKNGN